MTRVHNIKQLFLLISTSLIFATTAQATTIAVPKSQASSTVKSAADKAQAGATAANSGPDGTAPAAAAVPAEPPTLYGMAMPIVIKYDNPPRTHTYSGELWYQPPKWIWGNMNVYVAGRFGHWWSSGAPTFRALNIYSAAPVLRYYIKKMRYFSPYIEGSIGVGYLNRTQFGNRNLGMHFTFQDELGIGAVAGEAAGFYGTISILHYSNAGLSAHNSGITVPVMLTLGYQFN
jgi:hypothetical protein